MRLGIIISTNDPELVWNVYRLANFALSEGDNVKVFLLAKGVESESENEKYNVMEQIRQFTSRGGKLYACGTCIKSRGMSGSDTCPISSMKDLHQIAKDSDRVLTFG